MRDRKFRKKLHEKAKRFWLSKTRESGWRPKTSYARRSPGLSTPFSSLGLSNVPAGMLWMVVRGLRLCGQDERRPSRRRGAAECPSDPVCEQEERDDPSQLDGIFWIYRL